MNGNPSFLRSIRFLTATVILIISISFQVFELVILIQDYNRDKIRLVEDFHRIQEEKLKEEVKRIIRRQHFQKENLTAQVEKELQSRLQEAFGIVENYYEGHRGRVPVKTLERDLISLLSIMTYRAGLGCYYVIDRDGAMLTDGPSPPITAQQIGEARSDGSVALYIGKSQGDCLRYFPPLEWIVGTCLSMENMENDLQRNLLATINSVYTERADYLFVRDRDGTILNGPNKGENVFAVAGDKRKDTFLKMEESAERGGGFFSFPCRKKDGVDYLAYAEGIGEWNWLLGARVTTEELNADRLELEEQLTDTVRSNVVRIIVLSLLLGLIIFLILERMCKSLTGDISLFTLFFKAASRENTLMDVSQFRYREFADLGKLANLMIRDKIKIEEERHKLRNLESLGYLAGGIAHDFNNCLMGIYGNIELSQISLEAPEEARSYLENALQSMEEARKLTGRLLTFSQAGKPHFQSISLTHVLGMALDGIRNQKGIQVESLPPDDKRFISGDRDQIALLLEMVLANAREALPGGKGKISIKADNIFLEENTPFLLKGHYLRLDIRDNGSGISEENLPRIFDPFFSTRKVGRGLGLSTVYSIIHRHKGHVVARSDPGEGTVISLYFPAVREAGSGGRG